MSWEDECLPLLRLVIGDTTSPYQYCNSGLIDIFVGSAKIVITEVSFDNAYTITLSTSSISPDPSSDSYFLTLVSLKAAYVIANSEYKNGASNSLSITDGPSTISTAASATALKARVDQLYKDYEKAKFQFALGQSSSIGAVLTPTTYYSTICSYWTERCR